MFRDRHDAARQLVNVLRDLPLIDPLVLAVPRGGVVIGAVLADAMAADLDVVLSRKLRAPHQPELAMAPSARTGRSSSTSWPGRSPRSPRPTCSGKAITSSRRTPGGSGCTATCAREPRWRDGRS
jgi:hypothetical protein